MYVLEMKGKEIFKGKSLLFWVVKPHDIPEKLSLN
jgi:hypothetical protein